MRPEPSEPHFVFNPFEKALKRIKMLFLVLAIRLYFAFFEKRIRIWQSRRLLEVFLAKYP